MDTPSRFPIDLTSTEFYTAANLRAALLRHPDADQDKRAIHVESALYCRQNQDDAREFILFNLRHSGEPDAGSTDLLLDPLTSRNPKNRASSTLDQHSAQCLPLFTTVLGFLKPSYWKSLKEPGRFYVPNEGCLNDVLSSRGLSDYIEVDKIVFQDVQSFDLEHLIAWVSAVSTPKEFYHKRLAQSPCWFSTILWNAMTRISKAGLEPAADIQQIDNQSLEKLFEKVESELRTFRSELSGAHDQQKRELDTIRD